MNRNARFFCFLALTLAALAGCSGKPPAAQQKAAPLDKIVGKAQVLIENGGASDVALNAGGSSIYLWEGMRRYRMFLRTPVEVTHGEYYVAEGTVAQKVIEEIGDPDNGNNGYPVEASCRKAVTRAWPGIQFDQIDLSTSLVVNTVRRYPARPLFLVAKFRQATVEEKNAALEAVRGLTADENTPEVEVTAEKQKASLIDGPVVQPAPLWSPKGDTAKCKITINGEGKVASLDTGMQLCEYVNWSQFHFKPLVQGGKPARVRTEVEIKFEPRK